MTAEALYLHLYAWCNKVLNTDPGTNPPIAIYKSNQNIPTVSTPYIAISRSAVITKEGRSEHTDPDNNGNRNINNDYSLKVELWEVNSDGDMLRALINSIDRQDIKAMWGAAGFAYVTTLSPIQDLTALQNNVWRYEHMVEIQINTVETITDACGLISHVDMTGTIPPEGDSGSHEITLGG